MRRVAVVTGGSSGIGRACAEMLSERGWTVYELSRSGVSSGGVRHIGADVTDEAQIKAALAEVYSSEGRLDLLLNNAGMGISGAIEYSDTSDVKNILNVNLMGVFLCAREALPYLRLTPGAQIINISSVAAVFSIPYQAFYSASKAAVNSLTLALASELKSFGIRVNAVMPGDVKTGFTEARLKNLKGGELYGGAAERAVAVMEKDEQNGMAPGRVASFVCRLAEGRGTGRLYTVGAKYKLLVFLGRLLPTGLANIIVAKLYS